MRKSTLHGSEGNESSLVTDDVRQFLIRKENILCLDIKKYIQSKKTF